MSSRNVEDHAERLLARDPQRSVIVQAPAGSGKTELLMQRYLALLNCVADPEEILAVTFTRKAAAEMRNRILGALQPVAGAVLLPETAQLAAAVLRRNAERNWRLLEFPGRLRIRTLDSVNSWLRDSAPLSGEGAAGAIADKHSDLYELAASRTLELVSDDSRLGGSARIALRHLDNRADRLVRLLAQMLNARDQWLPLLGRGELGTRAREILEASLQRLVCRGLQVAAQLLHAPDRQLLLEMLQHAARHLATSKPDSSAVICRDLDAFPEAEPTLLPYWRVLADLLLVQSDSDGPAFRQTLNKTNGFPTPKDGGSAELNQRARDWLESAAGNEVLATALNAIRKLPEPYYSDAQWEALEALVHLLPAAAAQLLLIFREQAHTDYIQIAQDALAAFGTEDAPTDLALRFDYRVSHILIDEFQDTSRTQFALLEKLTAGWMDGDGRTLFVVGDPMQSIYRFRQAEVALFLQLWEHGIGDLRLQPVRLTTNFRSAPPIVDWVNATFAALMPVRSDPAIGAVQFAPGTAFRNADPTAGLPQLHACAEPGRVDEARAIADLVAATLQNSPTDTVGILVRTRHQARLLVPQLRQRGIAFAGAGLEQPGETAVEQDLLALTRALCHAGDRTAWLALLRAPWCGLSLQDLAALCEQDWRRSVYEQVGDPELVARLSADGQARVQQLRAVLDDILPRAGKLPLRDWIEGAWQQLGGPAVLAEPRDLQLAGQFFATLDDYDEGGSLAEPWRLHERLADREDMPGADIRVHLLTIFKAKGLEYDTVILPALDSKPRGNEKPVLAWHEFTDEDGDLHYLMAPITAAGESNEPIHGLINAFETRQAEFEQDRLLYVAATRARKQLHLYFELKRKKDGSVRKPASGSLLRRLWPVIGERYCEFDAPEGTAEARAEWVQPKIRRLVAGAEPVAAPARLVQSREAGAYAEIPEPAFDWAGSDAMRVGSVVHRCLQFIAERSQEGWADAAAIRGMLTEEGVAPEALAAAAGKVRKALQLTLADPRGQWLLASHPGAVCEFPITVNVAGECRRLVIDRSFIDAEGVRWIVDYKSSTHEGSNLDAFVASELQRYEPQLLGYRDAMRRLEPDRPLRVALYFPLLQVFGELTGQNDPAS